MLKNAILIAGLIMENRQKFMEDLLHKANHTLENESAEWRPGDNEGRPGGLVLLKQDLTTIIVPDLHGRKEYLPDLMKFKLDGKYIFELLKQGMIQIVCVGDGMHGERRVRERWKVAYKEYEEDFKECPAMAEEMAENFQTMAMVLRLKISFPQYFHFLKGNHENILVENINGNHPFAKFAAEGTMTKAYVKKFFGLEFLKQYDRFEKNLPLLARGKFFIITHARPKRTFGITDIINYRNNSEVIEGLTWTRHQAAEQGSVEEMFQFLIGDSQNQRTIWFAGHTAISEKYKVWEDGLVEIHNPDSRVLAIVDPIKAFNPDQHIVELPSTA